MSMISWIGCIHLWSMLVCAFVLTKNFNLSELHLWHGQIVSQTQINLAKKCNIYFNSQVMMRNTVAQLVE